MVNLCAAYGDDEGPAVPITTAVMKARVKSLGYKTSPAKSGSKRLVFAHRPETVAEQWKATWLAQDAYYRKGGPGNPFDLLGFRA